MATQWVNRLDTAMNPEVKSVTAAFVIVFIAMAAKHQWLNGLWTWLKASPTTQRPPVNTGTGGPGIVLPNNPHIIPTPGSMQPNMTGGSNG